MVNGTATTATMEVATWSWFDLNNTVLNDSGYLGDKWRNSSGPAQASYVNQTNQAVRLTYAVVLLSALVVGVAGNCLVAAAFLSAKRKTASDVLVVLIALTNVVYTIIDLPFNVSIQTGFWINTGTDALCKSEFFLTQAITLTSALLMTMTAAVRYRAVAIPLRAALTPRSVVGAFGVLLGLSLCASAPFAMLYGNDERGYCGMTNWGMITMVLYAVFFSVLITLMVITIVLYILAVRILHRKNRIFSQSLRKGEGRRRVKGVGEAESRYSWGDGLSSRHGDIASSLPIGISVSRMRQEKEEAASTMAVPDDAALRHPRQAWAAKDSKVTRSGKEGEGTEQGVKVKKSEGEIHRRGIPFRLRRNRIAPEGNAGESDNRSVCRDTTESSPLGGSLSLVRNAPTHTPAKPTSSSTSSWVVLPDKYSGDRGSPVGQDRGGERREAEKREKAEEKKRGQEKEEDKEEEAKDSDTAEDRIAAYVKRVNQNAQKTLVRERVLYGFYGNHLQDAQNHQEATQRDLTLTFLAGDPPPEESKEPGLAQRSGDARPKRKKSKPTGEELSTVYELSQSSEPTSGQKKEVGRPVPPAPPYGNAALSDENSERRQLFPHTSGSEAASARLTHQGGQALDRRDSFSNGHLSKQRDLMRDDDSSAVKVLSTGAPPSIGATLRSDAQPDTDEDIHSEPNASRRWDALSDDPDAVAAPETHIPLQVGKNDDDDASLDTDAEEERVGWKRSTRGNNADADNAYAVEEGRENSAGVPEEGSKAQDGPLKITSPHQKTTDVIHLASDELLSRSKGDGQEEIEGHSGDSGWCANSRNDFSPEKVMYLQHDEKRCGPTFSQPGVSQIPSQGSSPIPRTGSRQNDMLSTSPGRYYAVSGRTQHVTSCRKDARTLTHLELPKGTGSLSPFSGPASSASPTHECRDKGIDHEADTHNSPHSRGQPIQEMGINGEGDNVRDMSQRGLENGRGRSGLGRRSPSGKDKEALPSTNASNAASETTLRGFRKSDGPDGISERGAASTDSPRKTNSSASSQIFVPGGENRKYRAYGECNPRSATSPMHATLRPGLRTSIITSEAATLTGGSVGDCRNTAAFKGTPSSHQNSRYQSICLLKGQQEGREKSSSVYKNSYSVSLDPRTERSGNDMRATTVIPDASTMLRPDRDDVSTGPWRSMTSRQTTAPSVVWRRQEQERRLTVMFVAVTAVFVLCWMPPLAIYITYSVCPMCVQTFSPLHHLLLFGRRFHVIGHVSDVFIYACFSRAFRDNLRQLWRSLTSRCRSS